MPNRRPLAGKQVSIEPCHECGTQMRFELDLDINGNHVLNCPKCGHEHCRVVRDGKVTGDRWAQRNGPQVFVTAVVYTSGTSAHSGTSGTAIFYQSWLNSTAGTGY